MNKTRTALVLFTSIQEVLTNTDGREENKRYTDWKLRDKTVFTDEMIIYREYLEELIKKKKKPYNNHNNLAG